MGKTSIGRSLVVAFLLTSNLVLPAPSAAATVPTGFTDTIVASGMPNPTAMAFAPDGRLFVAQQGGALRVIKNGSLLATPFLTVTVNSSGERGLLGVAFDPDFTNNQYVYIHYTATTPAIHNRVSRFTANGDVAVPGSEMVLLDLPNLSATNHNGGAIHFGPDGKLYIGVGENAVSSNSQTLANPLGKMLRINSDGSIPTDNPFYGSTSGINRSIWAIGLRNPFTFAFQSSTGRLFINDVGAGTWEEINDGIAGSNYGWPLSEGPTSTPGQRGPVFAYGHGNGPVDGCAIAGGAFYNPVAVQFPASYVGSYFFADLCADSIYRIEPDNGYAVSTFATGIDSPVDLQVGSDGSLYYLARGGGGVVGRIAYPPPPETTYVPIEPVRVLDTRIGQGLSGTFSSNVPRTFAVAGVSGIPADAAAVTGNLTVTQQTGLGFVALTVAPTASPPSSTLNFPVGDNRANNVTIPLSATGTLSAVYKAVAGKTIHLIFDVTGYFLDDDNGATYTPLDPTRILDSRAASQVGPYNTPFVANVQREFPVWNQGGVPTTAVAVTGNLTVTGQTSLGFLALSNVDTSTPGTSTLNFPVGDNRANGVSVALTGSGSLWAVYKAPAGHSAHVIFDVTGYYEPGTGGLRFFPLNPGRILDSRINLGLSGAFAANVSESLDVDGHLGIPVGAEAITGNLTVTQQTQAGFAAMTPTLNNNPTTSTLNFPVGDNRANGVTVPLSGSGNTALVYKAASGTTHLILDITGYFD